LTILLAIPLTVREAPVVATAARSLSR
jgi:hypothetical protein